jgi:hypothetical protein
MRILFSFLIALLATASQAADFRGSVVASNATGILVAPTNFLFGNLWAGSNVYLEKTNRTGYRIHVPGAGGQFINNINGLGTNLTVDTDGGVGAGGHAIASFNRGGLNMVSVGYRSDGSAVNGGYIRAHNNLPFFIGTSDHNQSLAVLDSGFVGVGKTNPISQLDVAGDLRATNALDVRYVKYWGAKGDGVTDDTAAFQTAFNYRFSVDGNPGAVIITDGTYVLNSTVFASNQVVVIGIGQPVLSYYGTNYAIRFGKPGLSSAYNGNFEIHGCNFYCYTNALGAILFERWNLGTIVRNCQFPYNATPPTNANFTGITFTGDNWEIDVTGCKWRKNNDGHAIDINSSSSVNSSQARLVDNYFGGVSPTWAVRINGAGVQLVGNAFGGQCPAVLIEGGTDGSKAHAAQIVGNYFEAYTNSVIQYSGILKGAQIHNNYANVHCTDYAVSNYFVSPVSLDTSNSIIGSQFTLNTIVDATNGLIQATAASGQIGNAAWQNSVCNYDLSPKTNYSASNLPLLFRSQTPWAEMQGNTTPILRVTNAAVLVSGFGSGSLPLYTFENDPTTGMFLVGSGEIGFACGAYGMVRLNNNGMRIGSLVNPGAALDVSGDIRASTALTAVGALNVGGVATFTNNPVIVSGASSNFVWTCTNSTTGQGEWRTNAINSAYAFQPASSILTNLSGTGALTNANAFQPANAVLTNIVGLSSTVFTNVPLGGTNISVRTAGGTNFIDTIGQLNNWVNFSTNVWNDRQGGSATLTNLAGTGALTNGVVVAGAGTSNAWLEGRMYLDAVTATTNHTGTANYTNLFTYTFPGNTLTNLSDEIEILIEGNFRFGMASTNGFKAIYGTSVLFDTGFLTISNCPWTSEIKITRTGNSAQRVSAKVFAQAPAAGSHGNGTLVAYATNMPLAQVNGITNIFAFQGQSRVAAVITNDYRRIKWGPGPR